MFAYLLLHYKVKAAAARFGEKIPVYFLQDKRLAIGGSSETSVPSSSTFQNFDPLQMQNRPDTSKKVSLKN